MLGWWWYEGLPVPVINESAFATCLTPGVCVVDSMPSYPCPQGSWSGGNTTMEIQIKTTLRLHLILVRIAKINKNK